jgi:hypothetical protein
MEIRLSIDEQPTVSPARTGPSGGDGSGRIVVRSLSKRFGKIDAVRDLAVFHAGGFHHARKARAHLRCYAAAISIPQEGAC